MLLLEIAAIFAVLILLSMPIVFALAVAGIAGLWIGGYPMQQLSSALVSGSQSWVLLAIPAWFGEVALYSCLSLLNVVAWWVTGQLCHAMTGSGRAPGPCRICCGAGTRRRFTASASISSRMTLTASPERC